MKKWLTLGSLVLIIFCVNAAFADDTAAGAEEIGIVSVAGGVMTATATTEGAAIAVGTVAYTAARVVGASDPTVISTLSAVGGPAAVGAAGGFGTAKLMNDHLFSECDNQKACDAAKIGTYAGAAAGAAGVVTTVAMVGAGTTGLAAVGAAVGATAVGAVAVGATTLVVAPVVATATVGGLVYWWFSREKE
ncbi:MAG: hypothetical protein DRR19_19810 [Candidatus Parabeggiatoa sp. nov. 1]|nr:MAG: hypothetical protein DRR19_19810 [Gammaproteobacteria bacterium]